MSSRKVLQQTFGLMLVVLLLAGCGGAPAGPATTPTPGPPTATPTPACGLECTASTEPSLDIRITCELGEYTQSMTIKEIYDDNRTWDGHKGAWVNILEGTRTYQDTGNKYKIVGDLFRYGSADGSIKVEYHVEVTGGVFGETPRTCESD